MKKSFFMLLIFFICGMISADICTNVIKESSVCLDLETYQGYANAKLVYRDTFWSILYERIKVFLFVFLLSFTPLRKHLGVFLLSIFSFMWGFFILSCTVALGIAGIVVGICSVLPHGLLYGALIAVVLDNRKWYSYHQNNRMPMYILNVMLIFLFLLTGCMLESLISTHFIPWVIRLSLI